MEIERERNEPKPDCSPTIYQIKTGFAEWLSRKDSSHQLAIIYKENVVENNNENCCQQSKHVFRFNEIKTNHCVHIKTAIND